MKRGNSMVLRLALVQAITTTVNGAKPVLRPSTDQQQTAAVVGKSTAAVVGSYCLPAAQSSAVSY